MDVRNIIGANVKRLRQAAGLTQEELAARADFDQRFVSLVETGDRNVTIDKLYDLAVALGTTVVVLVSEPSEADRTG